MSNFTTHYPSRRMFDTALQNSSIGRRISNPLAQESIPEILFITSFPPRECGIATYSQDLITALENKFKGTFAIKVCAIESEEETYNYSSQVTSCLNVNHRKSFVRLAESINEDPKTQAVMIQHEFGLFKDKMDDFIQLLSIIMKPISIVFHTVLPNPDRVLKSKVMQMVELCDSIVVMTHAAADILRTNYHIDAKKITVIPHGTHLVSHADKVDLREKYGLNNRRILSTFGLLSSGKGIEMTLNAMPSIIKKNPEVLFLIIGKTHPTVLKEEGEAYRDSLKVIIDTLGLTENVKFINEFLPLPILLDILQLTDIYLFTSIDPNQAVSGTFSYAISCGCAIVSTPIPHAQEVLEDGAGIIVEFFNSQQLAVEVKKLLKDEQLRAKISSKGLHKIAPTAWENSAIAHAQLFKKLMHGRLSLDFKIPPINLEHFYRLTTDVAMIQFSIINQPDINSGFTLDDNARAMVAMCQHYELTQSQVDLEYIEIYLNFIQFCYQKEEEYFLNYVNDHQVFTEQNFETNLEDSNGRAIWALGFLISMADILPAHLIEKAERVFNPALLGITRISSTRAMAFIIKGLYYAGLHKSSEANQDLLIELSNRLVQMFKHEAEVDWEWFESYLTYGNSIIPEALLCAWLNTSDFIYLEIAKSAFDFLLSKIFTDTQIKVISNKGWAFKDEEPDFNVIGGEQAIDISYTILALEKFATVFPEEDYLAKMNMAFEWFLGKNHLHQIVYNPCTGGCYDGLEDTYINLNQGAESTVSYLMARLAIEKTHHTSKVNKSPMIDLYLNVV
ncbi:MAG: glycosyltransferase [Flectobacillus sp.]|nr:glycosyltransferase [Flectobacillus sp.]